MTTTIATSVSSNKPAGESTYGAVMVRRGAVRAPKASPRGRIRRQSVTIALIVVAVVAGCSGGGDSDDEGRGATASEYEAVLAAAASQRVFDDNGSGGGTVFTVVHVVERLGVMGTGKPPMVDSFAPGGRLLTSGEKDAIARALHPTPVEWVPNQEAVVGTGRQPVLRPREAVLTLAVPRFVGNRAEAMSQIFCGPTCGTGSTHVLEPGPDGQWTVTGATGIGFIS
jgi:hypothetical protein